MFVLLLKDESKRRYFRRLSQAISHAGQIHARVVVEWVWDGPCSGHHAIWSSERSYRQGAKPFAIVREC